MLLALKAANPRLKMRQLDVKTTFLSSGRKEEVYVRPPPEAGQPGVVWRLLKALYGLKQAARAWNATFTAKMQEDGYHASQHDPCLFMRGQGPTRAYVVVHVDDSVIPAEVASGTHVRRTAHSGRISTPWEAGKQ